jgi:hypothetical protein
VLPGEKVLDAKSGDFVAGNFYKLVGTTAPGNPQFQAKVYWVPATPEPGVTLNIEVRSLEDLSSPPITATAAVTASGPAGFFWPSDVPLPAQGRWRITASTETQWGCYDVSV